MSLILIAVLALLAMCLVFGAILGYAAVRFRVEGDPIAEQVNALLPQTQCGQCGYPGCKPYAEAIAKGDKINKCPPGGEATIQALADLLDVEAEPLDAVEGEKPQMVAFITSHAQRLIVKQDDRPLLKPGHPLIAKNQT